MSLNARERHVLDRIAAGLAGSDPKLAALLATFTRLTSGEEMPAAEGVRSARCSTRCARRVRSRARKLHERAFPQRSMRYPLPWLLAAAVLVVTLIAVTAAIAGGNSRGSCVNSWAAWTAACVRPAPAHSSGAAPGGTADPAPPAARRVPKVNRPAS